MLGLMRKEIYEKRVFLLEMMIGVLFLATAPFLIAYGEAGEGLSRLFAFLFLPFAYMMLDFTDNNILADETKTAAYFWGSTPKGKNGVVGAKYLMILMMCVVTVLYIFVETLLFDDVKMIMQLTQALTIFHMFLKSIELPFVFIFGAKHGMYIKTFVVTIVIFLALGYGLFGYIPESLSMESILDWINHLLLDENISKKISMVEAVAAGLVSVLYFVSYKISCRGYWHGVEEYES